MYTTSGNISFCLITVPAAEQWCWASLSLSGWKPREDPVSSAPTLLAAASSTVSQPPHLSVTIKIHYHIICITNDRNYHTKIKYYSPFTFKIYSEFVGIKQETRHKHSSAISNASCTWPSAHPVASLPYCLTYYSSLNSTITTFAIKLEL